MQVEAGGSADFISSVYSGILLSCNGRQFSLTRLIEEKILEIYGVSVICIYLQVYRLSGWAVTWAGRGNLKAASVSARLQQPLAASKAVSCQPEHIYIRAI